MLATFVPLYNVTRTEDTEAAAGTAQDSEITFTATRSTASVDLTVTSDNGTFASSTSSNQAAFSLSTTNFTGYTLTIASNTDSSTLSNGNGGTLSSISEPIDESAFNTTAYNNKWGYKPNYYNSSANSNYLQSPTTTASTLDETNAANTTAKNYTIALGARADYTASGTYSSSNYKLMYVANPVAYSISFDKGSASENPSNMPAVVTGSVSTMTVDLPSAIPTLTGYTFTGWCMGTVSTSSAEVDTCTGTGAKTFAAGDTFGIDRTSTNSVTLHAMWKLAGYTITFKPNGGTGSDYTQTIAQGSTGYLSGNSFTRSNYYFKGWGTGTSAVAYRPGQSITPSGDMTLYAIWGSSTSTSLYNIVASLNNSRTLDNTTTNGTGLSAKAGIKAKITKDNSGVFSYDSSTFGTASDASTSNTIYLYRGILDNVEGTYGSDGDSGNYPNYVKLENNTCWRILRTTGSGGVKLIYNGTYGATTTGSCANATTKAQVISSAFNSSFASNGYTSLDYHNIHAVGYTYNNSVTSSKTATAASTVFGSNSTYSVNSSSSVMKQYLENTWYTTNMTSYTSKLEPSAGYCNDRSLYASGSYASANVLAETTTVVPYGTSSMTAYYFGPYTRNSTSAQKPSLTCPRNVVDLYTTSSASNGNKQLGYPVALATADEMSFAGSGRSTASQGSSYNAKSFARSGSDFWLLSPTGRSSFGNACWYILYSYGYLVDEYVDYTYGVRPVISLTSGTTPDSGSGTATDPWVITPPTVTDKVHLWYYAYDQTNPELGWGSGWWIPAGDEEIDMSDPIAINTSYIETSIDPLGIYYPTYWEFDGYCVTPGLNVDGDPNPDECNSVYISGSNATPTFASSGNIDSGGNTVIRGYYRSESNPYFNDSTECINSGGTWNPYTSTCEGENYEQQCAETGGTWNYDTNTCDSGTQYEEQQCMEGGGTWMGDYCEYAGGGDPSFYGTSEECEMNGYYWDPDMGICQ